MPRLGGNGSTRARHRIWPIDPLDFGVVSLAPRHQHGPESVRTPVLLAALFVAPLVAQATSTIDTTNQYAWGANIGWTNWRPNFDNTNTEGVVVNEFICSGYIYAANVGWINMGNGSPADHIQYKNNSATDFGVNVITYGKEFQAAHRTSHNLPSETGQSGVALLRGYAYGANIGWINFEPSGDPRVSLFTGTFSGYAYSANCGWINLNDALGKVQTDHILMGNDTNGNGIADAWEYLYFGGLLAPGLQNSSPNGNGMTLTQDYNDAVDPTVENANLRITQFVTNPGAVNPVITFTSTTARLYQIEMKTDLLAATWDPDPTFGTLFAPDATPTTSRNLTAASAVKRYYRVKTMRPLP
jgi:hypothetical protein